MNSPEHSGGGFDFDDQVKEEPKRSFFGRIFKGRNTPEQVEDPEFNVTKENDYEFGDEPETWQELQQMIFDHDAEDWRERGLYQIYSEERIKGLGALMDGERDFSVEEDGSIRRTGYDKLKEFGHKALGSLVNRKNVTGAVALVGAAIITGGVGTPALMALAGGTIGRGVVEAWHSVNGKERLLRQERASLTFKQYSQLYELSVKIELLGGDSPELPALQEELMSYYNESNAELDRLTNEILDTKEHWNRRRTVGQFIGAAAGVGTGVAQGSQHLSEKAMTMDLDGNGVAHQVEKVNGVWHFIYNTAQEATDAANQGASLVHSSAGYAAHALGESGGAVAYEAAKNLLPEAGQVAAVLGGMFMGHLVDRNDVQNERENLKDLQAIRPDAQGGVTVEGGAIPAEVSENTPQSGEVWQIDGIDGAFRIVGVNSELGVATIEILNADLTPALDKENKALAERTIDLNDFLSKGEKLENPNQVVSKSTEGVEEEKTDENIEESNVPGHKVNLEDLSFLEEEEKKVDFPKEKSRWKLSNKNAQKKLPPELSHLGDEFSVYQVDDADEEEGIEIQLSTDDIVTLSLEDWALLLKCYKLIKN